MVMVVVATVGMVALKVGVAMVAGIEVVGEDMAVEVCNQNGLAILFIMTMEVEHLLHKPVVSFEICITVSINSLANNLQGKCIPCPFAGKTFFSFHTSSFGSWLG